MVRLKYWPRAPANFRSAGVWLPRRESNMGLTGKSHARCHVHPNHLGHTKKRSTTTSTHIFQDKAGALGQQHEPTTSRACFFPPSTADATHYATRTTTVDYCSIYVFIPGRATRKKHTHTPICLPATMDSFFYTLKKTHFTSTSMNTSISMSTNTWCDACRRFPTYKLQHDSSVRY